MNGAQLFGKLMFTGSTIVSLRRIPAKSKHRHLSKILNDWSKLSVIKLDLSIVALLSGVWLPPPGAIEKDCMAYCV